MPEIKLNANAGQLLFKFFFNVQELNRDSNETIKFQPYSAPDEIGAQETVDLARFLRTKVFKPAPSGNGYEIPALWTGKLPENYIRRLKQICENYKPAGRLISNCEAYADLIAALDGKTAEVNNISEDI